MNLRIVRFLYPKKKYGNVVAFFDIEFNKKRYNNFRVMNKKGKNKLNLPQGDYPDDLDKLLEDQDFKTLVIEKVQESMALMSKQKLSFKDKDQVKAEMQIEKAANDRGATKYDKQSGKVVSQVWPKKGKSHPNKVSMKESESKKHLDKSWEWVDNKQIKEMRRNQSNEIKKRSVEYVGNVLLISIK